MKLFKIQNEQTEVFYKKGAPKSLAKPTGKTPAPEAPLQQNHKLEACNFIKKMTPAQEFPYESRETPKNTHFPRGPPLVAFKQKKKVLRILDKILYINHV